MAQTDASKIEFIYQQLGEPWDSVNCEQEAIESNPYDRNVFCSLNGIKHWFLVHLVLNYYPKTNEGLGAYEMLYWVTDFTDPKQPRSDSHTLWIHNSSAENRVKLFESSVGIENDNAYLRLKIRPAI